MAGSRGGDTGAATSAADPEAVGKVFGEEEGWCRGSRVAVRLEAFMGRAC